MTQDMQFLRLAAVMAKTGKSRSSIYADMKAGNFPAAINVGPRAVAWLSTDIAAWQAARINESKAT
ncbi:AlpA family phage regulatory protein [Duganella sp. FT3S]|uniref:AlpA family phage regulatory protein n=1 Tax=Rugamonas fusca TaxID=2758568 RepID=A0A7W2EIA2_9BURK|nr:AlpA family phage regulatory protein [Rugamonas fusca]MBA5606450.1 AlpA family phage regulatory protein [Rugamonas fusca]